MTELTIDQALQQGIEAHKAGRVQEADRLYTAILKAQPKHPDANHNMGVLAVGVGKVEQALPFFKTALEANPATAQFWLSYIDALLKLEQLADAKVVLDQAKSKGAKGNSFDKLEQQLQEVGKEPLAASKTPAEAPPQQPNILDSLKLDQAISLAKKKAKEGSQEEARRVYQDILVKFPKNTRARDGLKAIASGSTEKTSKLQASLQDQLQSVIKLYEQGQFAAVVEQAQALTVQFPEALKVWNILGVAAAQIGKIDQATLAFKKVIAIEPNTAEAYSNLGNILKEQGKLDEAIDAYNEALAIEPDNAEVYNNLGVSLQAQGKLEKAIEVYKKALVIKPDNIKAYHNMGVTLKDQGKFEEAVEAFKKDSSKISQNYLLKCFYQMDKAEKFYKQLDYLVDQGENNAVIGSYISRSKIKYGVYRKNPFCNEPLRYTLHTNLTNHCDFEGIFIKGAVDVLSKNTVQNRSQSLLTNGIQTMGNIFNQKTVLTDKMQTVLRSEIEKYRIKFKDSQEGLIKNWPSNYQLYGWLVSMKNGGKLAAHMHDHGWISGSTYINVPPKVNKDSGNFVVCLDSKEESKSIDVITGSLCLFPSSLLHYTIPFESDQNRIVLAFDVIPK